MIPVAHALELTYPSFLPLREKMEFGELAAVLFGAALGIGSVFAVGVIIWAGWELATSSANPGKRAQARERVVAAFVGLAMLLGATILLRIINPDLPVVGVRDTITFPAVTTPVVGTIEKPLEESPTAFSIYPIGETLDATEAWIQTTSATLVENVDAVLANMKLCTKEACEARTRASYQNNYCGMDSRSIGLGSCSWPTWKTQALTCLPDPDKNFCEFPSGTTDTCPGRGEAEEKLPQLVQKFLDIKTFFEKDINAARAQIQACLTTRVATFYTHSLAWPFFPAAKSCSDCKESMDYFCESGGTLSRIHLPLDRLIALEEEFIKLEGEIYNAILSCSCGYSIFTCPSNFSTCLEGCGTDTPPWCPVPQCDDGCEGPGCGQQGVCCSIGCDRWDMTSYQPCYASQGVGACEDRVTNPNPRPGTVVTDPATGVRNIHPVSGELVDYSTYKKSCPPELWEELEKLHKIRVELESLKGQLGIQAAVVDFYGQEAIKAMQSTKPIGYFFASCRETQFYGRVQKEASCVEGLGCCPDDATYNDILSCRNEDFYYCGKLPPAPGD